MSTTPKTALTDLSNSAGQHLVVNADWSIIDQLLDRTVKDKDLATPPGSSADGDAYIVAVGASGLWSGKAGQIAYWRTSANVWQFIVPRLGWTLRVADELDTNNIPKEYGYTGSVWSLPAGTGGSFTGGTLTSALNDAPSVTLASAATVAIGAAAANTVKVTGTTTITAFDTLVDGPVRRVEFQGALTLTHHATALILPTGANITTAAGDVAEFRSLGSGNWKCVAYLKANGQALAGAGGGFTGGTLSSALNEAPHVTLASASTVSIGAAAANTVEISGTTSIIAFDVIAAGAKRLLWFQGGLTLTHHATVLILPTGASITTAAGDSAEFESLGSGNWRCVGYQRASGLALAGGGGGGLTYLTEDKNVATPNAAVPVVSLSATIAETDGDAAFIPKGAGAFMLSVPNNAASGGNKRGAYAVDLQRVRSGAPSVASGAYSTVIGGYNNKATGSYSIAGGSSAEATANYAVAIGGGFANAIATYATAIGGEGPYAGGQYSTTLGGKDNYALATFAITAGGEGNQTDGVHSSICGGKLATTRGVIGAEARASGSFTAGAGTAQRERFILRRATTDATATVLSADNGTPAAANQITLPNTSAYGFTGRLVARAAATGDCASWEFKGTVRRGGNAAATALVASVTPVLVAGDSGASTWAVSVTADTTLGCLTVTVTGAAATNIKWVADIETVEVVG